MLGDSQPTRWILKVLSWHSDVSTGVSTKTVQETDKRKLIKADIKLYILNKCWSISKCEECTCISIGRHRYETVHECLLNLRCSTHTDLKLYLYSRVHEQECATHI